MRSNKKLLLSIILVSIILVIFGCSKDSSSVPKKNIEEFLNKKSELYDKKDKIIDIVNNAPRLDLEMEEDKDHSTDMEWEDNYNEIFKDVKTLLTEKAYERLSRNRYFLHSLIEDEYDKSAIKDIEYEKVSEDDERVVYSVEYTEKLYSQGDLKEEKKVENDFTLEKIDGKWLISYID